MLTFHPSVTAKIKSPKARQLALMMAKRAHELREKKRRIEMRERDRQRALARASDAVSHAPQVSEAQPSKATKRPKRDDD